MSETRKYFAETWPPFGNQPESVHVGYETPDKPGHRTYASYQSSGPIVDGRVRRPATEAEIAAFEAEVKKREDWTLARNAEDDALLFLCGLNRDDFVRFRSVDRDGDRLTVCTRENGVGAVSVDAIRNPNYASRENDEGDSTYATYTFKVPEPVTVEGDVSARAAKGGGTRGL